MNYINDQIKSRERVRDLAEVLTSDREVNDMLDLVDDFSKDIAPLTYQINTTFLEPACGNGNFLVEILRRKLQTVKEQYGIHEKNQTKAMFADIFEYQTFQAVAAIYGIDIDASNIDESRIRLTEIVKDHWRATLDKIVSFEERKPFFQAIQEVLQANVILGDSINAGDKIWIVEYSYPLPQQYSVMSAIWNFLDMQKPDKKPIWGKRVRYTRFTNPITES